MQEYPFYTDEYKALAEEKRELLEEVGKKREKTRYDEIYDEALAQIEEAEKELEQGEKVLLHVKVWLCRRARMGII